MHLLGQHGTQPSYINKKAVARIYGCNERTVDRLRQKGILKAIRLGGLIRFDIDDVRAAAEAAKGE